MRSDGFGTNSGENTVLREFPPNPTLVNYHTRLQLTKQMSERYLPGKEDYPESWIAALGHIDGLKAIHVLRHKVRLKRREGVDWSHITSSVEDVLHHHWEYVNIRQTGRPDDIRRKYRLPREMYFDSRQVFEGIYHSRSHGLAQQLYDIYGITTLVFHHQTLMAKRGYCFPWEELEPQILLRLENFDPDGEMSS